MSVTAFGRRDRYTIDTNSSRGARERFAVALSPEATRATSRTGAHASQLAADTGAITVEIAAAESPRAASVTFYTQQIGAATRNGRTTAVLPGDVTNPYLPSDPVRISAR